MGIIINNCISFLIQLICSFEGSNCIAFLFAQFSSQDHQLIHPQIYTKIITILSLHLNIITKFSFHGRHFSWNPPVSYSKLDQCSLDLLCKQIPGMSSPFTIILGYSCPHSGNGFCISWTQCLLSSHFISSFQRRKFSTSVF